MTAPLGLALSVFSLVLVSTTFFFFLNPNLYSAVRTQGVQRRTRCNVLWLGGYGTGIKSDAAGLGGIRV
jgi:hypothetical protein